MMREGGNPWTDTIVIPWYTLGLVQAKMLQVWLHLQEMMFVNNLLGMLPFLALGALGLANLAAAVGALRVARRAEELGEGRFELLRDQHERLELLREERSVLLDELERERRERLGAQERVKQLMREHPHLELERELQRLREELELEREGRTHNHRERQRLDEELEHERLARSRDQQNVRRLERDLLELQQLVEERRQTLKASKKGLWPNLLRSNNH
jgi:hypothetical protein